jgi:hypothetical protein
LNSERYRKFHQASAHYARDFITTQPSPLSLFIFFFYFFSSSNKASPFSLFFVSDNGEVCSQLITVRSSSSKEQQLAFKVEEEEDHDQMEATATAIIFLQWALLLSRLVLHRPVLLEMLYTKVSSGKRASE